MKIIIFAKMNLTENIGIKEVYEWPNLQAMNNADRLKAIQMASAAMNERTMVAAQAAAKELQRLRDEVNKQFPAFGGNISIRALSWLRPVEWEKYRGRSGKGQHPTGHAVDFIFYHRRASASQINDMMKWAWKQYTGSWPGGLARLVRAGKYSFIHIDHRNSRARWEY